MKISLSCMLVLRLKLMWYLFMDFGVVRLWLGDSRKRKRRLTKMEQSVGPRYWFGAFQTKSSVRSVLKGCHWLNSYCIEFGICTTVFRWVAKVSLHHFFKIKNWVATWSLDAFGPQASTTGSQLLDRGHSHDWKILATPPWAPTPQGREADTHHTDKISVKSWKGGMLITRPKRKNQPSNPLKDAFHTLLIINPKDSWCPGVCYRMSPAAPNNCSSFAN